jgi:predicted TIM-barrel fold metal-dependent hydrolase
MSDFERLDIKDHVRAKILEDNASRVLGLSPAGSV